MASKAVDKKYHVDTQSTNGMESVHTNENSGAMSLPSPPSSVKATVSDSGRNEHGSHSAEVAGSEPSVSGTSASANKGVIAGSDHFYSLVGLQANG